ncbi:hypothetical protein, partial [Agromyces aerolatus]|uniref:hypothetical protein n=1 Tax=Agromyces sp. LY-1074 TaxID=3074080 RepID=UPI002854E7B5
MRELIMNGTRAWVAVLASAALLSGVGLPAAADAPAGSTSEARVPEIAVESSSLPPGVGVTVGGTNTVAADVLGLGYEQVVRLNGSRVEVVEPVTRGSAVLRSFEAGASHAWPTGLFGPVFYGGINMANRVGQGASRLAVAGEHIYVSNLRTRQAEAAPPDVRVPDGSVTTKYSVDGVVLNQRVEKPDYAVTALAGIEWRGKEYLAIGLNQSGVRIVDDTVQEMPDVHALMLHYSGPLRSGSVRSINERDQITQLRFGPVGDKLMLAVGVLTGDMPALL